MIGHYKITGELGRGGMGRVYKAHEMSLNRTVAIKVLAENLAQDETQVARFVREAQSAAALSHPNVVNIHFIGEDQGLHYFAMEYVDGESVKDLINREGALPPTRALTIVRQALAGLIAAHEIGLVHRDIKPANIMLTKGGDVKIADFGLAVRPETDSQLTATGMFVGTPGYLAPEQCMGEKADARTDIYSLGVTLYEMLTGRPPFEGDSVLAILHMITQQEPQDPRSLNPAIDDPCHSLLTRMMAKQREARFQFSQAVADEVDQLLAGGTAPPPVPQSLPQAATEVLPTPPPAPVHVAPTVPPKRSKGLGVGAVLGLLFAIVAICGLGAILFLRPWETHPEEPPSNDAQIAATETLPIEVPKTVSETGPDAQAGESPENTGQLDAAMTATEPKIGSDLAAVGDREDDPNELKPQRSAETSDQGPSPRADTESTADADQAHASLNETGMLAEKTTHETEPETSKDALPQQSHQKTSSISSSQPQEQRVLIVPVGDRLLAEPLRDAYAGSLSQMTNVVDPRLQPDLERMVANHGDLSQLLKSLSGSNITAIIYISVEPLSERTLKYMGRSQPAWTAQVTVRYLDNQNRGENKIIWSNRDEYTELSAERVAKQIERKTRPDLHMLTGANR